MKLPKIQVLYAFLSRLSNREKIIFYITAFIVSFMLLDRLIISPVFYKMHSLDKEAQEKIAGIKRSLYLLAYKDRIEKEVNHYKQFISSSKTEEEEMTAMLKDIETIANKATVYLIDMKPAGFRDRKFYREVMVKLNCEAMMEKITEFMYNIESSSGLFTITKYQLSPKSKDSSVARCSVSISKLIIP